MSVALATMDSAYGLSRLAASSQHHHHHQHHHHALHQLQLLQRACSPESLDRRDESSAPSGGAAPLRFSVVNILRPEFGREAILSTRTDPAAAPKASPVKVVTPLPVHSSLALPRDLSLSAGRLSPTPLLGASASASAASTHQRESAGAGSGGGSAFSRCGLASPVQRHCSSGSSLSRSGSLESLASSRSSVTGGSVNGAASTVSSAGSSAESSDGSGFQSQGQGNGQSLWPAWIYCTRYSDRPSSGPRTRRVKRASGDKSSSSSSPSSGGGGGAGAPSGPEEKRPRTAFSAEQLARLKREFTENRYLTEPRRQKLSKELGLNEQQIKIWFQNKRAKIKKASGQKNPLALQLMAQGLYNHSTVPVDEDGEEIALAPGQD